MSAALKLMAAILVVGVAPATWADDAQARRELVPTGALREAVAVAPAPSAFW
ncbi:MAG: amino acid ABC transporter substrate-binding protein, partial [Alphaproteobacteria bacterium]|nr:amino acid ABC transporter substrate-binding protein [Alphaproteobacteria bacterium]